MYEASVGLAQETVRDCSYHSGGNAVRGDFCFSVWLYTRPSGKGTGKSCFFELTSSALRIQEVTSEVEVMVANQMWHVKRHLHEPDYMGELAANMVKQGGFNILGGGAAFKPDFPSRL